MVHALDEIRRTIKPNGVLIDIRPVEENWPVEVNASTGYQVAGRLTDLPDARGRVRVKMLITRWRKL